MPTVPRGFFLKIHPCHNNHPSLFQRGGMIREIPENGWVCRWIDVSSLVPKNLVVLPFEFFMKMKDSCVLRDDQNGVCVVLFICWNLGSITAGLLCNTALLTAPPSVNTTPGY